MKISLLSALRCEVFHRTALHLSGLLVGAILLTGCVQDNMSGALKTAHQAHEPKRQLADYLSTSCMEIWTLQGHDVNANPLYWLRGMDCAERMVPAQARAKALEWPSESWADTFRRSILLSAAKITSGERRRYMTRLDSMTQEVPPSVRQLFQVWYDGQHSLLVLSDERLRYSKLQQSADGELYALREQQQQLRNQLALTARKLENLTDIERQLSSRKPGGSYASENHNITEEDSSTDKPRQEMKP